MAKKDKDSKVAEHVPVKPGTKEMETLLSSAYGMSIEEARRIVKERDEYPESYPYEVYSKAKAMIEAFEASPEVISKDKGWKRQRAR